MPRALVVAPSAEAGFGGLFSPPKHRRDTAFNNWGRGKNVKKLNNFAPSPIV